MKKLLLAIAVFIILALLWSAIYTPVLAETVRGGTISFNRVSSDYYNGSVSAGTPDEVLISKDFTCTAGLCDSMKIHFESSLPNADLSVEVITTSSGKQCRWPLRLVSGGTLGFEHDYFIKNLCSIDDPVTVRVKIWGSSSQTNAQYKVVVTPPSAFNDRVKLARAAGLQWLAFNLDQSNSFGGNWIGYWSLACVAFCNAGRTEGDLSDPGIPDISAADSNLIDLAVSRILSLVLPPGHEHEGAISSSGSTGQLKYVNYTTSTGILALFATGNKNYYPTIHNAQNFLAVSQFDGDACEVGSDYCTEPIENGWCYGGFGYGCCSDDGWAECNRPTKEMRPDLSNTQIALMALSVDDPLNGLPEIKDSYPDLWTKAEHYVSACQNSKSENKDHWCEIYDDGGFLYVPCYAGYAANPSQSYASMTSAGIWSLRLCGVDASDNRIQEAIDWFGRPGNEDCTFAYNWGAARPTPAQPTEFLYYYYLTLSKALIMCAEESRPCSNWYETLSNVICGKQQSNGSWVGVIAEAEPRVATAFALLTLEIKAPPPEDLWVSIIVDRKTTAANRSPVCAYLHVYDPDGKHSGFIDETTVINEITGAECTFGGDHQEIKLTKLQNGVSYRIELVGQDNCEYEVTYDIHQGDQLLRSDQVSGLIKPGEVWVNTIKTATLTSQFDLIDADKNFVEVPYGLVCEPGDKQLTLEWNWIPGGRKYSVYYGTNQGGPYPNVRTDYPSIKTLSSLTNGTTYYCRVGAIYADGTKSPLSQEISCTPSSPVNYHVFLIDRSGFMLLGEEIDGKNRFQSAIEQAKLDLNALAAIDDDNNDMIIVGSFASDEGVIKEMPEFKEGTGSAYYAVGHYIDNPDEMAGNCPVVEAIIKAADWLAAENPENEKTIWLYSSGIENASRHDFTSQTCGDCWSDLITWPTTDPELNTCDAQCDLYLFECEWCRHCDPNNPSFDAYCMNFQSCLANKLILSSQWNIKYYDKQIFEGSSIINPERTNMVDNNDLYSDDIERSGSLGEYNFLKYLAEQSGGAFSLVCDVSDPPQIQCHPSFATVDVGDLFEATVSIADPGSSGDITFSIGIDSPSDAVINAETGEIAWQTTESDFGEYNIYAIATDGCSASDTCEIIVHVGSGRAGIEKVINVYQGHSADISITFDQSILYMGGFDFLIAYDASALSPMDVIPGQFLDDCDWEYFTYRFGVNGNCGDACPSGLLRIIALAETNNGDNHPSCYSLPDTDPHDLAKVRFFVSNDRTLECQFVPVYFFWDDCGDNGISAVDGDILYIDRTIYNFDGTTFWDEKDDDNFPESNRIPFVGAPDYCLNDNPEKPAAIRVIDFVNGGIKIACADSIDARGDINLNGTVNEVADAVVFVNYFIHGMQAFTINQAGQIAATDVNADGIVLSVADLTYLLRIITGDAQPIPKIAPSKADYSIRDGILSIDTELGAAFVVIGGNAQPSNLTTGMDMAYAYDSERDVTNVLVYSMERNRKFSGNFLELDGTLLEIEAATYDGRTVKLATDLIPASFALHQNRPNPFNPMTELAFSLPIASDVILEIYNITGQKVTTLVEDHFEAGSHTVRWDASDYASGIYLYKITAGKYTDTKKMVLLK